MRYIGLITAFFVISSAINSQEKTVSGKVTTFEEIPVLNVAITVKSTGMKYSSDSVGFFSVPCAVKDRLVFSAEGFSTRRARIKEETKYLFVNMLLLPKPEAQERAIGYGHVKDKDKLYALAGLTEKGRNFSRYQNVFEILETNFAGVQVLNGEVIIRSASSFESSNPALLIVDGREVSAANLAAINTGDIADINILKDSSASIYGVRGANGVVVITTKRGGKQ